MTVLLLAGWVAASIATVAVWAHLARRRWDRHTADALAVANERPVLRATFCLVCPGNPRVVDIATHRRLCHQPREVGAEDSDWWAER